MMRFKAKPAKVVETIPTIDVVAAAIMAYHANGDTIIRADGNYYPATEFTPEVQAVTSNKTLMLALLTDTSRITQAARDEAQTVIQFIQGQAMLSILTGTVVSEFVRDINMDLETDTVPIYKVSLLLYVPSVYANGKKRESVREKTVEHMHTSQPLGKVGSKVTVNFTLIDKRYIQQYGMFAVYGTDEHGNLVSYLTSHEELAQNCAIVGKIKKAENDSWHNNAMVTSLHYVKAAK